MSLYAGNSSILATIVVKAAANAVSAGASAVELL
jgi:hypothetical protein